MWMCMCVRSCIRAHLFVRSLYMTLLMLYYTAFGKGYEWSPRTLTIDEGDFVEWTWTNELEEMGYRVEQTPTDTATEYKADGFRSGQTNTANGA